MPDAPNFDDAVDRLLDDAPDPRDAARLTRENNALRAENERLRAVAEAAQNMVDGVADYDVFPVAQPYLRALGKALAALDAVGGGG